MYVDETNAKEEEELKKKRYEKYFVLIDQTDNWFYGCGLPRLFKKKQNSIKKKIIHKLWLHTTHRMDLLMRSYYWYVTIQYNFFVSFCFIFSVFFVSSVFCFNLVRVAQIMLIFISFFFLLIFFDSCVSVASFTQKREMNNTSNGPNGQTE